MKKRLISLVITWFWLASWLLAPAVPVHAQDWQADWQALSSDIDRDGLLNDLESAGWYNDLAFREAAEKDGLGAWSINGDAFSREIKEQTIEGIKSQNSRNCVSNQLRVAS